MTVLEPLSLLSSRYISAHRTTIARKMRLTRVTAVQRTAHFLSGPTRARIAVIAEITWTSKSSVRIQFTKFAVPTCLAPNETTDRVLYDGRATIIARSLCKARWFYWLMLWFVTQPQLMTVILFGFLLNTLYVRPRRIPRYEHCGVIVKSVNE